MSLMVQGYSSDEDAAVDSNDLFGVSRLPAAKKTKLDNEVKVTTEAAPHVLAEVGPQYFRDPI